MRLSHAIEVFLLSKEIAGFSPNTLRNYRLILSRLSGHLAPRDPDLDKVSAHDLRGFLHSLQTRPPAAELLIPRDIKPLGPKSIRNVHAALSSIWGWAVDEGFVQENVVQAIEPPNPKRTVIEPFDQGEIRALLRTATNGSETTLRLRDRAILLFLLDTGVRASEMCNLTIADVDIKGGSAIVKGKGRLDSGRGKERVVMFGTNTRTALHRYLLCRANGSARTRLFATNDGRQINRRHLSTHLRRMGQRAGVKGCHPHRFRHTFAIMFLRNGGDIYTLQRLLGHSSLEMVKRYLSIAQTDIEAAHRRAGPVDNMRL